VGRCRTIRSIILGLSLCSTVLLWVPTAFADWQVYASADFGISTSDVETDGQVSGTPTLFLSGQDEDSSPLIGGAVGLRVPMNELLPREWLMDLRLPDWPVRFEIEGAGLREYEFRTEGTGVNDFFTEIDVSTFFINTWLDLPMLSAWKPFQYMFGLGRQPRLRRWLEPASIYLGTGVGFSAIDVKGTDNVVRVDDDSIDFAWNAGVGIAYEVSEHVTLASGYRYIGVEEQDLDLRSNAAIGPNDSTEFDQDIHEFRMTIRVALYDFLSPWR